MLLRIVRGIGGRGRRRLISRRRSLARLGPGEVRIAGIAGEVLRAKGGRRERRVPGAAVIAAAVAAAAMAAAAAGLYRAAAVAAQAAEAARAEGVVRPAADGSAALVAAAAVSEEPGRGLLRRQADNGEAQQARE